MSNQFITITIPTDATNGSAMPTMETSSDGNRLETLETTVGDLKVQLAEKDKTIKALLKQGQKVTSRIDVIADMMGSILNEKNGFGDPDYGTSQENVWSSDHGFRYVVHHATENWNATRIPTWELFLKQVPDANSICEFGCNIGANLKAINQLLPESKLSGIEINPHAVKMLKNDNIGDIHCGSILDVELDQKFDLVFSRGVLIHIKPDEVHRVMQNMANHSKKYVLIYEHYSPELYQLPKYRLKSKEAEAGEGYQFWRDYCGEFHGLFPDWKIVAHGTGLEESKTPKHGNMHWTVFERPTDTQ